MCPALLRQLWGLAVRCEQAIRAIAPCWHAQKASWGEAARLFDRLTSPAIWLGQFATIESNDGRAVPEAVMQLLASSVATILKAAKVDAASINSDFLLPFQFVSVPALRLSTTRMLPAAISLQLPRMASSLQGALSALECAARAVESTLALSQYTKSPMNCMMVGSCHMATLIDRTAAGLLHSSETKETRRAAHYAAGRIASHAAHLSFSLFTCAIQVTVWREFGLDRTVP